MTNRAYTTVFFLVILVLVLVTVTLVLRPFFAAIAWAFVLANGFATPWRWLSHRFPGRKGLAAAMFSVVTALLVIVPLTVLLTVLVGQASDAVTRASGELERRQINSVSDVVSLPVISRGLEWVQEKSGVTPAEVQQKAQQLGASLSKFVAAKSGGLVVSLFDMLMTFLVTIIVMFFFLRDGEGMAAALTELVPLPTGERTEVVQSFRLMLQAIFRGSLLCALVQGATGAIGWAIAGLPSPVLAGAFMAVLSLLPIGGTAFVWLPGTIYLWLTGHHGMAIFLGVWGLVVTSFLADNILKPILIGGATEMDTLIVFLGVFGGIGAFGLLGIFIGPISLALAKTLLDILRAHARKGEDERAIVDIPVPA